MLSDPLHPPLSSFTMSEEETSAVQHALTLKDSWKLEQEEMAPVRETLKALRGRIKEFHLQRQKNLCCYCRSNLYGGGFFVIDREHIVPKSHCKDLTYEISNLSVACKRCNMEIKKDKIGLLVDPENIKHSHKSKGAYKIIHPNFEVYEEYILRASVQSGTTVVVSYYALNDAEKTKFMFDFFKLHELETDSLNAVQGKASLTLRQNFFLNALKAELSQDTQLVTQILALLHDKSLASNGDIQAGEKNSDGLLVSRDKLLEEFSKRDAENYRPDVKFAFESHIPVLALPPPKND